MIEIYTDGSALARNGHKDDKKGGLGILFLLEDEIINFVSKGYYPTTIGRMELRAVLIALKMLDKNETATIFSDSMYVINCFNENWFRVCEKQEWPPRIKNVDILKELHIEFKNFPPNSLFFKHVKGHNGNKYNEIADSLASYKNFKKFSKD